MTLKCLRTSKEPYKVVTLEDGILDGGFGEKIAAYYAATDMKVYNYGLKKEFIDRYSVDEILKENRITPEQILRIYSNYIHLGLWF